jgi:neopullulanase
MRLATLALLSLVATAQPVVTKVEPPDWWTGTKWNPVQLLIRGRNLAGAKVSVRTPLRAGNVRVNANGTYLRVDVRIPSNAAAGLYPLTLTSAEGKLEAPFRLMERLKSEGRFQGFSNDDVIYLIMPDRFANGDLANDDPAPAQGLLDRSKARYYHGGDLQGVIDKLDYLKELGVTAVWLNPWYDNSDTLNQKETYNRQAITDYHGYGAIDFYGVEQHFGTLEKLIELVEKAHAKGIKIMQDQVANHTGPYHPWTQDPPTPAWYHGTVSQHLANDWQTWTLIDPHATPAMRRTTLDGWFINILPDLNQEDSEVETYLIQNSLWWAGRTGLDAIRQDTLPYAPRTYWAAWMRALKSEFPRMNVVGEVFDGDPALTSFFQGGVTRFDGVDSGVDSVFDFPVYFQIRGAFARGGPVRDVARMMAHDELYVNPSMLVTFLGLHDVDRFMNEKGATAEGLKLAWTFLFTARGVPMIYYGDEIGLRGGGDPDNRRDFPGGWANDAHNAFSAGGLTPEEQGLYEHVKKLGALRRGTEALRIGATTNLAATDQTWAYTRSTPKSTAIAVFNNGASPAAVEFDAPGGGPDLRDALGSAAVLKLQSGRARVELPARSAAVFIPEGKP